MSEQELLERYRALSEAVFAFLSSERKEFFSECAQYHGGSADEVLFDLRDYDALEAAFESFQYPKAQ